MFFIVMSCCTSVVQADDYYSPGGSTYLELSRYGTSLKYPAGDQGAHIGHYGIAYSEPLGGDVIAELHAGYATLDLDNAAPGFTGRYLGTMVRYEGSSGDYFNLSGEFAYTWHDVNGNTFQAPQAEIVWYETWFAFGPVLRYDRWRLGFGAYYQDIEGKETDTQPSQVLDFQAVRSVGAYSGITFYIDPSYSLGLYFSGGARDGVQLVFRMEF